MFGLGPTELIVIGVVALIFFGPKRLPELAKGLGKGIRDFKKALDGSEEEAARLAKGNDSLPKVEGTEAHKTSVKTDSTPKS